MTNQRRILLLESDENLRELLRMSLQLDGFEVISPDDGAEAQREIEQGGADAVLSCVMFPSMDAFALLAWLREHNRMDVPVVILTCRALPDIREELLQAGAREVLFKPVRMSDLVDRLKAV
ncbi:MAG: DNA-binding response regulator [Zetaproteobacteria bacterium]|nr:MAG: DNA-binding response regulator [Zetaproteobacteria bacterium]